MRDRISAKDSSQTHASLGSLQRSVDPVLLHHEREGAFDGFGLCLGTKHGLRTRQLRVIELKMFVPFRSAMSHGPSPAR